MGLNCRAGQLAWIDVPRDRAAEALGSTQLQGRVVRTVRLKACPPFPEPAWQVEPPQAVRVVGPVPPSLGVKPGDVLAAEAIPDAWLRPFEDLPPQEVEQPGLLVPELTS